MFSVEIAGIPLAIENRYAYVERLCADYRTNIPPENCAFTVSVTPEEITAENNGSGSFSPAYCESLAIYRKISLHMLNYQAFLFHAAVIAYNGRGYAFAAKSGTGKSTHVAQWINALGSEVSVVNGDKPLLRAASTSGFVAYGTPYNGKEGWGQNTSAPLRAVCFIERCQPGEADALTRLSDDAQIINRLMPQILLPKSPLLAAQQLSLLNKLVTSVPFYLLRCTPTKAAFDAAFQMTLCDNERNAIL